MEERIAVSKGEIRDSQLASMVAEEMRCLLAAAEDPRLQALTVTSVSSEHGGKHFIVCLAPDPDSEEFYRAEEIKRVLKAAHGFLRSELAEALNFKRSPDFTFMVDPLYPPVP